MKIYVDLQTMNIVTDPRKKKTEKMIELKRGDTATLDLAFIDTSMVRSISSASPDEYILGWPEGTTIRFSAKAAGDFDGTALVYSDNFISTGPHTKAEGVATGYGKTVESISVTSSGSGYTTPPTVTLIPVDGNGSGATAEATLSKGAITGIVVLEGGYGYDGKPTVVIEGGGGSGATAEVVMDGDSVDYIRITNPGTGYTSNPTVTIKGGVEHATGVAVRTGDAITDIVLTNPGIGYASAPDVTLTGGGAGVTVPATATATVVAGRVTGITITEDGAGYTEVPTVAFSGGGIVPATATASISPPGMRWLEVVLGGSGYGGSPIVTMSGGEGPTDASARAVVVDGRIVRIELPWPVSTYSSAPTVAITDGGGGGSGATATAVYEATNFSTPVVTNPGSGYDHIPSVTLNNCGGAGARANVSGGRVTSIDLLDTGRLATGTPSVSITGGAGSGARAEVVLGPSRISSFNVNNGGSGYGAPPTVTISGGGGSGASARAIVGNDGKISMVILNNSGSNYTSAPTVSIAGAGSGATAKALIDINGVSLTLISGGSGYSNLPNIEVSKTGGGSGLSVRWPESMANFAKSQISVRDLPIPVSGGSGHHSCPKFSVSLPERRTLLGTGVLQGATVTIGGTKVGTYSSGTYAIIQRSGMSNLVLPVQISSGDVAGIDLTEALASNAFDDGMTTARTITIVDPAATGSGRTATWNAAASSVKAIRWTMTHYTAATLNIVNPNTFATFRGALYDGKLYQTAYYKEPSPYADSGYQEFRSITIGQSYNISKDYTYYVGIQEFWKPGGLSYYRADKTLNDYSIYYKDGQQYDLLKSIFLYDKEPDYHVSVITRSGINLSLVFMNGAVETKRIQGIQAYIGASGQINSLQTYVSVGGSFSYTTVAVEVESYSGSGAIIVPTVNPSRISSIVVTDPGSGYNANPRVMAGITHVGNAVVSGGAIVGVTPVDSAPSFSAAPLLTVSAGSGTNAAITATLTPPPVASVRVTNGGSGYNPVSVTIEGDGSGATAQATVSGGSITAITITNKGSGYTTDPQIVIPAPFSSSGVQATAACTLLGGRVTAINITNPGSGYLDIPVVFTGGDGSGARAVAFSRAGVIESAHLISAGTGYTSEPEVEVGGDGTGADLKVLLNDRSVTDLTVTEAGSGYATDQPPVVRLVGGGATTQATASAELSNGVVRSINLLSEGSGYSEAPSVVIESNYGYGAEARAFQPDLGVASIAVTNPGTGYTANPTVAIEGDGSGATAVASTSTATGSISGVTITDAGRGYIEPPTVSISAPPPVAATTPETGTTPTTGEAVAESDHRTKWRPAKLAFRMSTTGRRGGRPSGNLYHPIVKVDSIEIIDGGAGYTSSPTFNAPDVLDPYSYKGIIKGGSVIEVILKSTTTAMLLPANLSSNPSDAVKMVSYRTEVSGSDPIPDIIPTTTTTTTTTAPKKNQDPQLARTATARATVLEGSVAGVTVVDGGSQYLTEPTVTFSDPALTYSGVISLNGTALATALGSGPAVDQRYLDLDAEVEIRAPGAALEATYVVADNVVTVTTTDPHQLEDNDPVRIDVGTGAMADQTNVEIEKTGASTFTFPLSKTNTTGTCSVIPIRFVSTKTVTLRVHNDVNKGDETYPE
jgi:hypothetical protein